MARLLIALVILSAVVMAAAALAAAFRPAEAAAARGIDALRRGPDMPGTFQKIAYVLLVVLMIGVAAGWVGSL